MDSTRWNELQFRDDDIVVAAWAKSGTTWTQQILAQLIFEGDPLIQTEALTPWLDLRILPKDILFEILESQTHRRFIKTHLPVDALVFSPQVKYLYVARDFPDVVWSLHNHLINANDEFYDTLNTTPGRVGPTIERPGPDIYSFWKQMLENDAYPLWSFWENLRSWWAIRTLPNVKLIHFNDLKKDLPGEIRGIASFLNIPINEVHWEAIVEHCSFDWMKQHAELVTPRGGSGWEGGAKTFINKGSNKRWKELLSDADIEQYLSMAEAELGAQCTHWLVNGTA